MQPPHFTHMLARLLGPAEPEIGCDQCFDQLDSYLDLQLAGHDADTAFPGLHAHLHGCPACREDYESLRALISAQNTR